MFFFSFPFFFFLGFSHLPPLPGMQDVREERGGEGEEGRGMGITSEGGLMICMDANWEATSSTGSTR